MNRLGHADGPEDRRAPETAADIQRVVADQIGQLRANPDLDPLRKARQIGQLARVALQAIETATLEARLDAMEAVLRHRKDQKTQRGRAS